MSKAALMKYNDIKWSKIAEKVFKYKSIAKIVRVEVGRNLGLDKFLQYLSNVMQHYVFSYQ